jgi:GAF domain-containing protein
MGAPWTGDQPRVVGFARLTWLTVTAVCLASALAAFVALVDQGATTGRIDSGPLSVKPELVNELVGLGVLSDAFITAGDLTIRLLGMALFAGIALVLAWRGGHDPVRLAFSAVLILLATSLFAPLASLSRAHPGLSWLTSTIGIFTPTAPELWRSLAGIGLLFLLCVFPDGRFVPRWSAWALAVLVAHALLWAMFPGTFLDPNEWSGPMRFTWLLVLPFAGLAAQLWRYAHAGADTRRQTRLVVFALGTVMAAFAVLAVFDPELEQGVGDLVVTTPRLQALYELQLLLVLTAALFLFPISIAVSVLRYRLLDIDIVVNRALIYGSLAAFIGVVYISVVIVVGAAVGSSNESEPLLVILTLAIVAFTVDAVRQRAERFANRLVYGERATPYEMLATFSHGLSRALSSDEVLPRVAEAAAQGVRGVAGRARLDLGDGATRAAYWPDDAADARFDEVVPIRYHGEQVGELAVAVRRDDPPSAEDRAVLAALADQAAPALHNLALDARLEAGARALARQADDLQASRRRIVTAREDAVGDLVAEVEDRVERALTEARETLVPGGAEAPASTEEVLGRGERATTLVRSALESLRDIAHGVYPPVLAGRGLAAAVQAAGERSPWTFTLDASATTGTRYDADLEAVVYFCVVEATQLLGRAGARSIAVTLADGPTTIAFEVRGDGPRALADDELERLVDHLGAVGGTLRVESDAVGAELAAEVPAS